MPPAHTAVPLCRVSAQRPGPDAAPPHPSILQRWLTSPRAGHHLQGALLVRSRLPGGRAHAPGWAGRTAAAEGPAERLRPRARAERRRAHAPRAAPTRRSARAREQVEGLGEQRLTKRLGSLPIMLKSRACYLRNLGRRELVERKVRPPSARQRAQLEVTAAGWRPPGGCCHARLRRPPPPNPACCPAAAAAALPPQEEGTEFGGTFICNGIERIIRMLVQVRPAGLPSDAAGRCLCSSRRRGVRGSRMQAQAGAQPMRGAARPPGSCAAEPAALHHGAAAGGLPQARPRLHGDGHPHPVGEGASPPCLLIRPIG